MPFSDFNSPFVNIFKNYVNDVIIKNLVYIYLTWKYTTLGTIFFVRGAHRWSTEDGVIKIREKISYLGMLLYLGFA